MVTVSGCQNITTWLEKSPVISYTALWQALVLAIHSHHPVTTIIVDKTIKSNFKLLHCCLSYTHTLRKTPTAACTQAYYTQIPKEACKYTYWHFLYQRGKKRTKPSHTGSTIKEKNSLSLSSFNRLCRFGHVYERAHTTTLPCHSNLMTECLKFWGLCEKIRISSCGSVVF